MARVLRCTCKVFGRGRWGAYHVVRVLHARRQARVRRQGLHKVRCDPLSLAKLLLHRPYTGRLLVLVLVLALALGLGLGLALALVLVLVVVARTIASCTSSNLNGSFFLADGSFGAGRSVSIRCGPSAPSAFVAFFAFAFAFPLAGFESRNPFFTVPPPPPPPLPLLFAPAVFAFGFELLKKPPLRPLPKS